MPELLTRMDEAGWLTPAIAEVLQPLPPRPYDDAAITEQARLIEQSLGNAKAPVKIMGRGALPSHTLFFAQLGRARGRRETTLDAVKAALPQVAEALGAKVDLLPRLDRAPDAFGLLVRGEAHQPLVLRSLLMQPGFQESASPTTAVLGLDLQQSVVVRDLSTMGHVLLLGGGVAKDRYLHAILLVLMLFNTPAEMQLALVGNDPATFEGYKGAPHLVGRPLTGGEAGRVAVQRMAKEVARREALFEQAGVSDLEAYNTAARASEDVKALPRTLMVIDTFTDPMWIAAPDAWGPALKLFLERGAPVGMHALVVSQTSTMLPPGMINLFGAWLVLPSASGETPNIKLPEAPLHFADALLVEGEKVAVPVTQCVVPPEDIAAVAAYWERAAQQKQAGAAGPHVVEEAAPPESDAFVTDISGDIVRPPSGMEQLQDVVMPRARALAAYLGWLGPGPLRDILGLEDHQAQTVINQLRDEGLLEPKVAPVLRYQRLAAPPTPGPGE